VTLRWNEFKCAPLALALVFLTFQARAVFDTVVLDPGHGGWDKGGLRNVKLPEKKMTLLTSLVVRDLLEEAGLKVVMTRETDVYIPLSDRVQIGNSHDDAIFVSVHYNADYGSSGHGIETYCARGSKKSMPLRDKIHRQLIRRTGARDRGVRTAGFYVLRHTATIAVLVEGGFLSNPREAKKIADVDYRYLIAECIADGILDYRESLGGSKISRKRKPKEQPKEALPVVEKPAPPKKTPAKEQADASPKPAAKPKPPEAKKPAPTQVVTQTPVKTSDKPEVDPKPTAPVQPAGQNTPPPDTNSLSTAQTDHPAKSPEPIQLTPAPEPPPASAATNQFRATGIGLRN
jgi:N-acetylmuramoyl-L-alanine amidase